MNIQNRTKKDRFSFFGVNMILEVKRVLWSFHDTVRLTCQLCPLAIFDWGSTHTVLM